MPIRSVRNRCPFGKVGLAYFHNYDAMEKKIGCSGFVYSKASANKQYCSKQCLAYFRQWNSKNDSVRNNLVEKLMQLSMGGDTEKFWKELIKENETN